ncbi:MAG TPA: hypothetical protein VHO69_07600 [Phototrophicaceae bacterium]|nr:hypothetical protein [Phototrophicaceae bacterium]
MNVATIIAILIALLAVITAFPRPSSSKPCSLGYKALCSFTPISTVILLVCAGIVWLIGSAF